MADRAGYAVRLLEDVIRLNGEVVRGFGRGSKMLGIPTANLCPEALGEVVDKTPAGVYFGWAQVDDGPVYKTVLSIGWNPYFKNEHKTVEPHILHEFAEDFYGRQLRVLICGWLRPEADFPDLDSLIKAIHTDIEVSSESLDRPEFAALAKDDVFLKTEAE